MQIDSAKAELAALGYSTEMPTDRRAVNRGGTGRPLRAQVLDALDELGLPAYSREVTHFLMALKGARVEPSRFGALRAQEMKAFDGPRPRSVYISYGLTHRGEAIKRLLCRSDWRLEDRVVAPTTGRVQHLRMTKRLCELALEVDKGALVADRDLLSYLAADHARDLPGVKFKRGNFEFHNWCELAAELLAGAIDRDRAEREHVARRLRMFPERLQIFGSEKAVDPEPRLKRPITADSIA